MKERLLNKIDKKELIVGVIGLGYVGLPLAVEKAKAGYQTIGFDIQKEKVDKVNRGENYIGDVVDEDFTKIVNSGKLKATSDFSFIEHVDFIVICVPTPLDLYRQPDMKYVKSSSEAIAPYLKNGSIVVLESTTYPGTTEELIKPILENGSGLVCGRDFYLGFSPERVDPGNRIYKTKNTPKVVGGIGEDATNVIAHMYRQVLEGDVKQVSSPAVAEMEKLLENTYRNVNIALINEVAMLCNKMNIDVWEVIEAAKTKPYGFQAFYPGAGVGGHCIPLDPYYLAWKAREFDFHTTMIESAAMINDAMPAYCVERVSHILNKEKKAVNGSKILLLGIAYKQNIDDYRESPALSVFEQFMQLGALVDYYDAYVPVFQYHGQQYKSLEMIDAATIQQYDLIMITTAHTNVDYQFIGENASVIFDAKNAMKDIAYRGNIEVL